MNKENTSAQQKYPEIQQKSNNKQSNKHEASVGSELIPNSYKWEETNKLTKEEIIKIVYNEDEFKAINSVTPEVTWEEFPPLDHVMNYKERRIFGKIENIYEVGIQKGLIKFCSNCTNGNNCVQTTGQSICAEAKIKIFHKSN
ncbi:MAG: hypothetical protein HOL28_09795 [Crocinitomicaceae bacterium]|nr:hypothetical protein [Crocinitomicaceae bacterium]